MAPSGAIGVFGLHSGRSALTVDSIGAGQRQPVVLRGAGKAAETTHPSVSIVMPCLDEEETVGACVEKAVGWLERRGIPGEVLVVDNGSTDRSVEIAEAAGARVIHERRRGYGQAYLRGFSEAAASTSSWATPTTRTTSATSTHSSRRSTRAPTWCSATGSRAGSRTARCRGHIGTSARPSSTPSSGSSSAPASATARAGCARSAGACPNSWACGRAAWSWRPR